MGPPITHVNDGFIFLGNRGIRKLTEVLSSNHDIGKALRQLVLSSNAQSKWRNSELNLGRRRQPRRGYRMICTDFNIPPLQKLVDMQLKRYI